MHGGLKIKKIFKILLATAIPVIVADVLTKTLIMARLPLGGKVEVIPGFFNIVYYRNTGAAFSILASAGHMKTVILGAASVASVIIIALFLREARARLTIFSLSLILGGAIGNLSDRMRFGWVVDFLEVYIGSYAWPAFNVADSAITVGVAITALSYIIYESRTDAEKKKD